MVVNVRLYVLVNSLVKPTYCDIEKIIRNEEYNVFGKFQGNSCEECMNKCLCKRWLNKVLL